MKIDYPRLATALQTTIQHLRSGEKQPERARKVTLRIVNDLEGMVTNGEYEFGVDAAIDAGGAGKYARPMDYVLGGLLSCQHMWCLRWAADKKASFQHLQLSATGRFTWRGEYLDEVDAGLTSIDLIYDVVAIDLCSADTLDMADTVARRCPVFATLRKSVCIMERIVLNGEQTSARAWMPGERISRQAE